MSSPAFLPFARPTIGEDEIAEVVDTLRSGWLTTGPKARRFEQAFGEFLGAPQSHCVAVNSATAGLHLALEALGIGPGDEVITSTLTFTATAEVVRYLGADVVLVDVDEATLALDPQAVAAAITPRTRAVLPVHYAGLAADLPALMDVCHARGIHLVEDAAHALPATSGGRLVGTHDTAACVFSFYANKTMTTGEGGMLVTRDADLAARARVMRLHGISRDAFDRFTSRAPGWYYEVIAPGFKYNLTDLAASVGLHQLKRVRDFRERREHIAQRYHAGLADLPVTLPARAPAAELHAWHLYVLRLEEGAPCTRDVLIERLHAAGIGCSVHYTPLHRQPYWRQRYGLTPAVFPRAERASRQMLSLPIYDSMSDTDVERVIAAVHQGLGG